jgi:outer membrane protein
LVEKKLVNRIQKAIFKIVEEIGKKEGYLLVVEKREGGVLYFPNTIDITDKLIHQYNAEHTLKSEAEKKKE